MSDQQPPVGRRRPGDTRRHVQPSPEYVYVHGIADERGWYTARYRVVRVTARFFVVERAGQSRDLDDPPGEWYSLWGWAAANAAGRTLRLDRRTLESGGQVWHRELRHWFTLDPEPPPHAWLYRGAPPDLKAPLAALGLAWPTTRDDVKRAYRKTARKAHPDAGGSREDFVRVNDAYRALLGALR
jgi:hypothetical protein